MKNFGKARRKNYRHVQFVGVVKASRNDPDPEEDPDEWRYDKYQWESYDEEFYLTGGPDDPDMWRDSMDEPEDV